MIETSGEKLEKICACKGIRTCPKCEEFGKQPYYKRKEDVTVFLYCCKCQKAWPENVCQHFSHTGSSIDFPGIYIHADFVSEVEENELVQEIYQAPFVDSQSGRRKQDYGPKVNFKKRKVKLANFTGLPNFSRDLVHRMRNLDILSDFSPVEQCHLEYIPERGSSLDPHFDDFWLWGDRLVTVNLLSDTVLYFVCDEVPNVQVCVPLSQRSLIVVYGEARTKWKHGIHRNDIKTKRLAITLRELSFEFSESGKRANEGKELLNIALNFDGKPLVSKITSLENISAY